MVVINRLSMNFHDLFEYHGQLLKIDRGNYIFQEGELARELFLIRSGKVQINKEIESGKELTLRISTSGSILGESSLFNKSTPHSTTAIALSPTEMYVISKDSLELLLTEKPALLIEYLKWLQVENIKNQSLIRDLVMNGKKGALYSTLIRLSNTYGEKFENDENKVFINFNITNTEIANLCSTSREMVNRMLNDLKKQKMITFDKGYITILNLAHLKNEICCENCPLEICRID